ncbi:MAG: aspartate-semialdehyde dehydrogenase [Clostridia bacterium]
MINCAIVGATGLVGKTFLKVLEEKNLSIDNFFLLASSSSKGKKVRFLGDEYIVEVLNENTFENTKFDYALFSAGGDISKKYIPLAVKSGCVVIDNSSIFRMKENVPLIVPEVNLEDLSFCTNNIIANPNCSTIQAVVALKPLHDKYTLKRVIYSTYQAVSGAGKKGLDDLENTTKGLESKSFPYRIYNNCIPQIDMFLENGYSKEEMKIIEETKKILHLPKLKLTATAVRCPIKNCHGESINVEFESAFDILDVRQLLSKSPGIALLDDVSRSLYPLNTFADNKNDVFIGRLRRDFSIPNGLNFWCVADNLRKGAATNAVQILEKLLQKRQEN